MFQLQDKCLSPVINKAWTREASRIKDCFIFCDLIHILKKSSVDTSQEYKAAVLNNIDGNPNPPLELQLVTKSLEMNSGSYARTPNCSLFEGKKQKRNIFLDYI